MQNLASDNRKKKLRLQSWIASKKEKKHEAIECHKNLYLKIYNDEEKSG